MLLFTIIFIIARNPINTMIKKVSFEREAHHGTMPNEKLTSIISVAFDEEFGSENWKDQLILRKVSDKRNNIVLEAAAYMSHRSYGGSYDDVGMLDEPKLIAELLGLAQEHRIINGDVHRLERDLKLDGEYVLAFQGKPRIKVLGFPEQEGPKYIFWPTRIESFQGDNFFSHTPHPPENKVDLELSITDGKNRGIVEKTYKAVFDHYREAGFDLTEHE